MDFKLYGFSEKLPLLAAFIFRSLAHLQVLPERFVIIKEALLRNVRLQRRVAWGHPLAATCAHVRGRQVPGCPTLCWPQPGAQLSCLAFPVGLQYRNVNMSPSKHATYQRLLALKERFWHADQVWAVAAGQAGPTS